MDKKATSLNFYRQTYGPFNKVLWDNHIRYISPKFLNSSEKMVLFVFMASRPMGEIFLSNETLCFQCSMSLPTIKKILRSLKLKEFIKRFPHKKSRSFQTEINEVLILQRLHESSPEMFKQLYGVKDLRELSNETIFPTIDNLFLDSENSKLGDDYDEDDLLL